MIAEELNRIIGLGPIDLNSLSNSLRGKSLMTGAQVSHLLDQLKLTKFYDNPSTNISETIQKIIK